jgi:hypothetical protein
MCSTPSGKERTVKACVGDPPVSMAVLFDGIPSEAELTHTRSGMVDWGL